MWTCRQTVEMATDRSEGSLDGSARIAFDEHLLGCAGCAAYVRQLDVTRQALGRLPEPEVSPALSEAILAGFDALVGAQGGAPARDPAPGWRFSPWPTAGALVGIVLLLAFARQRSQAPDDWAVAAVLALAALAVASRAGRLAVGVVLAAVAASIAAALAGGSAGGLDVATGAECLAMELALGALVAGAAWVGVRGETKAKVRPALATGGLAGALAADAALQLACHSHGALPHLLAFHVGGVVVVAAVAAAVVRSARRAGA